MLQSKRIIENKRIGLRREHCIYTSCYCEENIYKLIEHFSQLDIDISNLYAVIISNDNKSIFLWQQKSSTNKNKAICWDYHVILLEQIPISNNSKSTTIVWDLDSTLDFPCSFETYVEKSLMHYETYLPRPYQRYIINYKIFNL